MIILIRAWELLTLFSLTFSAASISAFISHSDHRSNNIDIIASSKEEEQKKKKNYGIFLLSMQASSSDDDDDDETTTTTIDNQQEFSMKQDWALIDAVPRYTVNSNGENGGRPATFWNQLSSSTPELSLLSPDQLRARYEEISKKEDERSTTIAIPQQQQQQKNYGPQPPILDQWIWSEDGNKVRGRIENNGSTVWFPVAARGWLEDDPLLVTGGWIITLGGTVYELGEPAAAAATTSSKTSTTTATTNTNNNNFSDLAAKMKEIPQLVVVTAVATIIGFLAGSSFEYMTLPTTVEEEQQQIVIVTDNTQQQQKEDESISAVVAKYRPDSISERRVKQERSIAGRELQIVRDTESIVRIQSKIRYDQALLEKDKEILEKLRQLEISKGGDLYVIDVNVGSTSTTTANPNNDLTIAQLRGQQERRITGKELQIVRETERITVTESKIRVAKALLEQDKAGLEKIKELENQMGGNVVIQGQIL